MGSVFIGIGASAGGLEAISELLSSMPARPGAAILVVQHLQRSHDSLLSGILRRRTALPVLAAEDGMEAQPDSVYVIPPNVTLTVAQGRLVLAPRAPGREVHRPIDALFHSLAAECGDSAVGVVLSGGDNDGSEGIKAIKQAGGITFAQAPETAGVPSMPLSAIDSGCVDFVLSPEAIGQELVRLSTHPYLQSIASDAPVLSEEQEAEFLRRIFRRLRTSHGVDFTRYKASTLRRRLSRRMALQKLDRLDSYTDLVERDAGEAAALYQDFLIRVTSFFRDPDSFRLLAEQVFPRILSNHSLKDPIRIWVPGCATGEEVYSLAIALIEVLGQAAPTAGIQIFGTDVSESSIEKCRAGVYSDAISADVSAERLRRFFVKRGSQYVIARPVRDLCVFARHDITRDPPYSRLDLVSCKNLLIYLGSSAQGRVMQIFRYALRPGGYLMLGPAETVGQGEEFFEAVDKQQRLYQPRQGHTFAHTGFQVDSDAFRASGPPALLPRRETDYIESDAAQRQADRVLLSRYSPPAMLIDDAMNILQFRGETAPYLAPANGAPSLNLSRIARPELMLSVPSMLQEARQTGKPVQRSGIYLEGVGAVNLEAVPLSNTAHGQCFLILFESPDAVQPARRDRRPPPAALSNDEKDQRIAQVEQENFELREFLQSTMEHQEAAKEELKSAHEELLSANEEFQSTNEELETSKEELQSANEELTTTNEELRERNRMLAVLNTELGQLRAASERARAYADGIINTVRQPLVVLDGSLVVLRVNKAFCEDFLVVPERMEGQSLQVVSRALWDESLNHKLMAILASGPVLEDFEVVYSHPREGARVLCLNGRKIPGDSDRGELILLSIEDITDRRRKSDAVSEGSRRKDEFLAMLGHELRNPLAAITHANAILKLHRPELAEKMREMIERQTGRLVRLVNDLLDATRISRGLIELQRRPVDLTRVVRDAADGARGRLEQQAHVLTVSVPDFPMGVEGDPVRLEQVVANLLENAIKYTPPGGRIAVDLREVGEENVLTISDNGIGIAPAELQQVFEVFRRLDNAQTRVQGGLGLGLTLVRRILELHGGRIEAQSAGAGAGSQFIAYLPRRAFVAVSDTSQLRALRAESPDKRRRVLIVDDNVDSAAVLALELEHWGYEVETADTGAQALRLVETFVPDFAFVDIGLPDIDGREVARRIRAMRLPKPLRLIALTGFGTEADRELSLTSGFDEHVVKPMDPDTFGRVLRDS